MTGADTEPASATFDLVQLAARQLIKILQRLESTSSATDVCVNDDVTFTAEPSGCNFDKYD